MNIQDTPGRADAVAELLVGAVDLHCHSGPAAFPRRIDHRDAMKDAEAAGFEALVYKDHFYPGMAHATLLQTLYPDEKVKVYSGVALNNANGGINGRPFTMYKFRSMGTNAEQRKHELAAMNEMTGPVFKVANDPRITPIGRFLRRFSLDELPQLFNVLKGAMSLVGPRCRERRESGKEYEYCQKKIRQ